MTAGRGGINGPNTDHKLISDQSLRGKRPFDMSALLTALTHTRKQHTEFRYDSLTKTAFIIYDANWMLYASFKRYPYQPICVTHECARYIRRHEMNSSRGGHQNAHCEKTGRVRDGE